MKYFRNFEIANIYHVSQSGVGKWVESARRGNLDIELHEQDGKFYIANTAKNLATIESLTKENKKYVNTNSRKVVKPSPRFYELYGTQQVADIVANLDTYREIPLQYSYFDGGANYWDKYAAKMYEEAVPNTLNNNVQLLDSNYKNIDRLIGKHQRVNVIDLGVGNALPVKNLLGNLLDKGILNRYIGIDISKDMLKVAERNIRKWYGDKINVETYARDIGRESFSDLLVDDYFTDGIKEAPLNMVLLFGGTINNFRNPHDVLRLVNNSMAADDLFVSSMKLDTTNSRRFFVPFDTHRMTLDLLNFDSSWYEVEGFFDPERRSRFMRIRLNVSISIEFELDKGKRSVDINKGETIITWRVLHQNYLDAINRLDKNGFNVLQSSMTRDKEYLLVVAGVKTGLDV